MNYNLKEIKSIYFIGIGGIGMSALARFFHLEGKQIAGYDLTQTPLTEELAALGIPIIYEDSLENIPKIFTEPHIDLKKTIVIYTPAIPANNQIFVFFQKMGIPILKRSDALQLLTADKRTFAVAGTHGKTTTSILLAHILAQRPEGCNAFLGGIAKNYNSNLICSKKTKDLVVEADEFDRTFLKLFPYLSVITAMDPDHLDVYGTVENMREAYYQYAEQVSNILIYHESLKIPTRKARKDYTYSLAKRKSDFYISDLRVVKGKSYFTAKGPHHFSLPLTAPMPGKHNIENALAACAAAHLLGISDECIKTAFESFTGIYRRFETLYKTKNRVIISDYAHHPAELKAAILGARLLYPTKLITGIFQPHLFTRTRDLMDDFAQELSKLDHVFVTPIYAAREKPITGVTSAALFKKIQNANKKMISPNNYLQQLKNTEHGVLLILGAGDFVQYIPNIIDLFEKNEK